MKLPRAHHLSDRQLAAQMLMPAVHLDLINRSSPQAKRLLSLIRNYQPGGIIIFGGQPPEVHYWVNRLQAEAKYPLLVAADLERGVGAFFGKGSALPHAMAWGAANDEELTGKAAAVIAAEARVLGIHVLFAPVLDLANQADNPIINIRAFHALPEETSRLSAPFIRAVQNQGIACVGKHFPGHGRAQADSHLTLPSIPQTFKMMQNEDLIPFEQAVKTGIKGIMSAHIRLEDNSRPATFRPDILNDFLRKDCGFNGVLFSDALNMKAISHHFSPAEQVRMGLAAGLDIFLMPERLPLFHHLLSREAAVSPEFRQKMEQSVDRIFLLKKWLHRYHPKATPAGRIYKILSHPRSVAICRQLAEKSVTCLHAGKQFPLNLQQIGTADHFIFTDFEPDSSPLEHLNGQLQKFFREVNIFVNSARTESKSDLAIISLYSRTFGGHRPQTDQAAINKTMDYLCGKKVPVVVLIFGSPFQFNYLKNHTRTAALFLLYSYVEASQIAAFRALLSFIPVNGKLPVVFEETTENVKTLSLPERPYRLMPAAEGRYHWAEVDGDIEKSIENRIFPGGVLLVAQNGEILYHKAFGHFTYEKKKAVEPGTAYDLSSLTKPLATTPAVLQLMEKSGLALQEKLRAFYGELRNIPLGSVTIEQLLRHRSGLPAWKPFFNSCKTKDDVISDIFATHLQNMPGQTTTYSDLNFIILGDLVERISGLPLDEYCRHHLFLPMGLPELQFIKTESPLPGQKSRNIPPSGFSSFRGREIQGEVNDDNCYILQGTAGHAGLFGTAADAAAAAQMFLNKGLYNSRQILHRQSVDLALQYNRNPGVRRLGWDLPTGQSSSGKYFSADSFGHLAFTGPSIWADPQRQLLVVFLCNRSHPDPQNNRMGEFRPHLHDAVIRAIGDGTEGADDPFFS
ncbi:MAG: glycoside hydrolase family 3 N-terminal domain-containing protein [Calditrichia bacterium]